MAKSRKSSGKRASVPSNLEAVPHAIALRRVAKGNRAQFYENQAVDQLFAVVTALTAEVSVAFDRIAALERVLVDARAITAGSVESYLPSVDEAEARNLKREALIQRVFSVFEAYGATSTR